MFDLPIEDLDCILNKTEIYWRDIKNEQFFITGGSGFFGNWMTQSFAFINEKLELNNKALVLTRYPFGETRFQHSSIEYYYGELDNFEFPAGHFSNVVHLATVKDANPSAQAIRDSVGTKRVLDFSVQANTSNFLYTSSGAVYGKQPKNILKVSEEFEGSPSLLDVNSSYGLSKRMSEYMCNSYFQREKLNTKIARCFAFVGPRLPLDKNYAIGNFINDALQNKEIEIGGDGTPLRSYMYAADLATWLWTILFTGKSSHPYNVGADNYYSIREVAEIVCKTVNPTSKINISRQADPSVLPERYLPDITRATTELGLNLETNMEQAILKTFNWNKK